jgi:hypothetical protein
MTMKGKTVMSTSQGKGDMMVNVTSSNGVDVATGLLETNSTVLNTDMKLMGRQMNQHMVMTMRRG